MGTMDMDSVPPATITSAEPERSRSAARAMACKPEEQKRLMVIALVSTGSPARSAAMRATFMPCSPSGMAQPRITSSISLGSTPGTLERASLMARAARSSGRVVRSDPLKARPTGVRTAETMTASGMVASRIEITFLLLGGWAKKSKSVRGKQEGRTDVRPGESRQEDAGLELEAKAELHDARAASP